MMDRHCHVWRLLLVVCSAMLLPMVWTISVRKRPSDVYLNAGDTAEVSCDVDSRDTANQIIGWFHADSETFINYGRQMQPSLDADKRSRYSVTGSEAEDIYTLRIESVSIVDGGTYQCGYYGIAGRFTPLVHAMITVRRLPSAVNTPQCRVTTVQGHNPLSIGVGDVVDFICRWTDPRVISASWGSVGKLLNTRVETNYVWTRKKLTATDNGQNFTCTLMTSGSSHTAPRTCSVAPLRILPTATIAPLTSIANVGDTVEFTCEGHGLPEITSYMWMSSPPEGITEPTPTLQRQPPRGSDGAGQPAGNTRERVQVSNSNVLRIMGVRRQDNGMTVACQVHVASGMSATALATLLVISRPPSTATLPPYSSAKVGRAHTDIYIPTDNSTQKYAFTDVTGWPDFDTNRNTMPALPEALPTPTMPPGPHSTPTQALDGSVVDPFNSTFIIALAICGLILFILLLFSIILTAVRWSRNNTRQHLKLANGQLPLQIINDTYGELANTATSRDDKTYEEMTTVVTIRMTPTSSTTTTTSTKPISPKRPVTSSASCPIYATPNKLKRNSTPIKSSVQYMNMPDVPSHYDAPSFRPPIPRPSTPPPPPPPRYEDLPLLPLPLMPPPPLRRHRPLGPAASCTTTFSRSTYSSLTSEEDFRESPDIIDAIRANHMAAFKEETDIPRNNSCIADRPFASTENHVALRDDEIEDEYVSLQLPANMATSPNRLLNVEGLQYADLVLDKNASPDIKSTDFPTQYAHIATASTRL